MADQIRKFESESMGLPGLQPVQAKSDTRDLGRTGSGTSRRKESRDTKEIKAIVLRLIDHFERGFSVIGDA